MDDIALSPLARTRQAHLSVLAHADAASLARLWQGFDGKPDYERVRGPETGLVMVRGRTGGGGAPFNLGEATVTRATVRLASGTVGHAYALGRDGEKVTIAALCDALVQEPASASHIAEAIIAPLMREAAARDDKSRRETEATRVNFFTMVRGED